MAYFRCGGGGVPASVKTDMNAVLNKKFGTSTDYPPADWAPTVNLMGPLPEKTQASASVCSFDDGADDVPTKSLVVTIPPTLSGVSSVTETQTGKNLLDISTAQGTGTIWFYYDNGIKLKKGATYTFSCGNYGSGSISFYRLDHTTQIAYAYISESSAKVTYTPTEDVVVCPRIYQSGLTVSGLIDVILEVGSTATAYEPYQTPTTYTASLGRTIYGGTADIVNGEGTESYGRIIFDGSNDEAWQKHGSIASWFYIDNAIADGYVNSAENDFMICNLGTQAKYASVAQLSNGQFAFGLPSPTTYRFVFKNTDFTEVADFKEWLSNNNMQVVYKLATPTDFTFTGQEVPTRLGYNAFWADEGDTEVTYRADIDLLLGGN